jgi:hypothetical protein
MKVAGWEECGMTSTGSREIEAGSCEDGNKPVESIYKAWNVFTSRPTIRFSTTLLQADTFFCGERTASCVGVRGGVKNLKHGCLPTSKIQLALGL